MHDGLYRTGSAWVLRMVLDFVEKVVVEPSGIEPLTS